MPQVQPWKAKKNKKQNKKKTDESMATATGLSWQTTEVDGAFMFLDTANQN